MTMKNPGPGAYGIKAVPANTPGAMTCGHCGLSWAEDITPAGRCPWEYDHVGAPVDAGYFGNPLAPALNLNGSSAGMLLTQLRGAINALRQAQIALAAATPHGRDYQTLPFGAYSEAADAHSQRQKAVRQVAEDLSTIYDNVLQQAAADPRHARDLQQHFDSI